MEMDTGTSTERRGAGLVPARSRYSLEPRSQNPSYAPHDPPSLMLDARYYERYEMYHHPSTSQQSSPLKSRRLCPSYKLLHILTTITPLFFLSDVLAIPLGADQLSSRQLPQKRADDGSGSNMSPQIWAPIIIVVLFVVGLAILTWRRKSFRSRLASTFLNRRVATDTGAPAANSQGVRELTAEQLAGSINRNADTTSDTTAATAARTRRNRRPRRTPSQISTTSLPAYHKEPGDEELVIFRGPEDMEDAMPTALVMPVVDEDEESSIHSGDNSQPSRYSPMPTTPHDMPLLSHNDTSVNLSEQNLQPPGEDMPVRQSYDSSSEEVSHVNGNAPGYEDSRGEAPPYFEVVAPETHIDTDTSANVTSARSIAPSSSPPPQPDEPSRRRSGFRSLFNIGSSNRTSIVGAPQGTSRSSHFRTDSGPSIISSDGSHSQASHRPSQSSSGSFMSALRHPRPKVPNAADANPLSSPSLISLNAISAPLTHTLVRTEFTYPKSGPTPEQLKLISSRETFARFGMPYGADAIAYASASRQELMPPPGFDADSSESLPARTSGPSRLRATSNAADILRAEEQSGNISDASSGIEPYSSVTSLPAAESSSDVALSAETEAVSAPDKSKDENGDATVKAVTSSSSPSTAGPSSVIPDVKSTLAHDEEEDEDEDNTLDAISFSDDAPPPSPLTPTNAPKKLNVPPPVSFRSMARSESRLSSYSTQTFATAAETMEPSTPRAQADLDFPDADELEPLTPTTPRIHASTPVTMAQTDKADGTRLS